MNKKKKNIESLDELEKSKEFQIPEGYFDQLQKDVFSEIDKESAARPAAKTLHFRAFYRVAASIALLAASIFTFWYSSNQRVEAQSDYSEILSEVSDDEIIAYLEYSDVSYSEIASFMSDESRFEIKEDSAEYFEFEEQEADALLEYYSL